ncbi:EamA-like transporter family protein [Marinobacter zhejiangensis]|uniref:EamA-like transporter family protein n=2 Tax=Marinobacter zhejiangensis TaxID=488535 RepID=A0A1I4MB95_9GAMM|nr:EamA-like transporter family protein [Marinobacter zhejiangensis]
MAYLLLIAVGFMVALMLPLAKVAIAGGMTPLSYAFWQALGGGGLLWLWSGRSRGALPLRTTGRYFLVSGLTAIAIPNIVAFLVLERIGPGLTSTLYAMPSLMTYVLAVTVRIEGLRGLRVVGLGLGVLGCIRIMSPDSNGLSTENLPWLLLGLLVPLSLAIGNVYRSVAWPAGAGAKQLAPGMLLGGALVVAVVMLGTGTLAEVRVPSGDVGLVLLAQAVLSAVTYRAFFELQRRSSPVFLSQIGFVVAPAGLLLGFLIFGERYGLGVWLGVAVLMAGVLLANWRK